MLAAMPPTSPTPVNRDEAPVRERGDACPGALRLHAADDGHLARLRLPAGVLTYRQAEVLGALADRMGDGHLDITSRGNLQLRGLGAGGGGELARALHEAGLLPSEAHERVRNIVASPLAGLDATGHLGPSAAQLWPGELDGLLCASPAAAGLSGRFLFALDDGRGDVAALDADVTLLARSADTAVLYIGANRSGWRVSVSAAPRAALIAATAFLDVARASGSGAWRVRELPGGHGLDAAVTAGLASAGIPVRRATAEDRGPAAPPAPGTVPSPDGTVTLSAHAPLGRLDRDQWRLLAATASDAVLGGTPAADGTGQVTAAGTLRLTPWRGVIVPGVPRAGAAGALRRLDDAGLITDPRSPWHQVGACTGRPGCAKSLSDVRADAARALPASDAAPGLPLYWSGCDRRCGRPGSGTWVDAVATAEGSYALSVRSSKDTPTAPTATASAAGPHLADAVAAARTTTTTR